jgi:hypothetical protein
MSALLGLLKRLVPMSVKTTIKCWRLLEIEYGHRRSYLSQSCVDKAGRPIPWYTYPAIEYIRQLDFSDKHVFEYGSGNSSRFWSALAKGVVSVEDDREWYEKVRTSSGNGVRLVFAADKTAYIDEILNYDPFDVIIVDGSHRLECAQQALKRLMPGGMIILDNSDWFVETARLLRESDLIQVDMAGFAPINAYTSTTSIFLRRDFRFRSRTANQPEHGIGGLKQYGQE